jgi:glutaredoxin 3
LQTLVVSSSFLSLSPQARLRLRLTLTSKSMAKVEIYTWRMCPFCIRAKHLLGKKGVEYVEYAIDGDEKARDAMVMRGSDGRRSVPQIFINDKHIGGCDALQDLDASGKLDPLLV